MLELTWDSIDLCCFQLEGEGEASTEQPSSRKASDASSNFDLLCSDYIISRRIMATHELDMEWMHFPAFPQLPPNGDAPLRGWVLLAEVVRDMSFGRPVYHCRDREGNPLTVALYGTSTRSPASPPRTLTELVVRRVRSRGPRSLWATPCVCQELRLTISWMGKSG